MGGVFCCGFVASLGCHEVRGMGGEGGARGLASVIAATPPPNPLPQGEGE